ncbi:acetyl-CoA carboxylase, carboxyltransferase subunit beta [Paraclostridium bifermentans]|uniref:Acetyl-coenzyme A carboxylase carboxyl transferase subunit beta n=1 Tax=Paraclostridium bifermentans TaxID=1490 RepID=A0AA44DJB3_PARBF|nr:acetyl-CoA carboxylase, carboxyltransferase subunit beta [Paraclostridium bifermentans]EQK38583.1 acetyl-CoA carboxylase, carboxyl transferase, beta subunit [[Clostridium] bifermentans ATCC 19299] [Paraclostridium bifermentans ATCC 19299]MBN8047194.1 acetyl-CoA carboxylase carboxyltransferase subunit beta [Paraclostridium bifermentans]MCR1874402.1 acetyl-CoA carboxylase, carboxyltransferase subunit beta [Paraclostridium bifermentans]NME08734.1 acetyl-CoA carboxylase carboxyltransferase subun
MIKKFLNRKGQNYAVVHLNQNFKENSVDDKFWIYCETCKSQVFRKDIEENLNICPKCNKHYDFSARKRIKLLLDENSFEEFDYDLEFKNILNFPDYETKISKYKNDTNEKEAVITGKGLIHGVEVVLCVMNPKFMMGSMGAIVGEKITQSIEYAIDNKLPVLICCASGGARMQEGMISLMQMAKTSQALSKLSDAGLLYISILTNPTTGGVTASFATLGDIIIAEPNALIAFAGPRVIKQTIKQDLPKGFQTSEFLLEHGFVDLIVNRDQMKDTLFNLLSLHGYDYCKEGDLIAHTEH